MRAQELVRSLSPSPWTQPVLFSAVPWDPRNWWDLSRLSKDSNFFLFAAVPWEPRNWWDLSCRSLDSTLSCLQLFHESLGTDEIPLACPENQLFHVCSCSMRAQELVRSLSPSACSFFSCSVRAQEQVRSLSPSPWTQPVHFSAFPREPRNWRDLPPSPWTQPFHVSAVPWEPRNWWYLSLPLPGLSLLIFHLFHESPGTGKISFASPKTQLFHVCSCAMRAQELVRPLLPCLRLNSFMFAAVPWEPGNWWDPSCLSWDSTLSCLQLFHESLETGEISLASP